MNYIGGGLIGAGCGTLALLLALGALQKKGRKLIVRLIRMKRFPMKRWSVSIVVGVLLGCYGIWVYDGFEYEFANFMMLTTCLYCATLTDLHHRTIHMDTLLLFAALGMLCHLTFGGVQTALNSVTGALLGVALLGIPHLLRRDSVGVGDVALLGAAGIFKGAPAILYLLARALIVLAVVCIVQLVRKKATRKSVMPFAPFLLIGALI